MGGGGRESKAWEGGGGGGGGGGGLRCGLGGNHACDDRNYKIFRPGFISELS